MIPRKVLIFWANREYSLIELLKGAGLRDPQVSELVFCPFHDDRAGGHRSAKIFEDALHCFSESRQYRQYDILKFLGFTDGQIENNLRVLGNPPTNVYEDRKALDISSPLQKQKIEYIKGKITFYQYVDNILFFIDSNQDKE